MTRLAAARLTSTGQPEFANEAEFQTWIVKRAYETGWGISGAADKKRDAELEGYGYLPEPLSGLVFHPRIMYRTEPGWPDLALFRRRDRRVIFAECKTDAKASKLMPRQSKVLGLLCGVFGVDWLDPENRETVFAPMDTFAGSSPLLRVGIYVWRPSDLAEIARVLV